MTYYYFFLFSVRSIYFHTISFVEQKKSYPNSPLLSLSLYTSSTSSDVDWYTYTTEFRFSVFRFLRTIIIVHIILLLLSPRWRGLFGSRTTVYTRTIITTIRYTTCNVCVQRPWDDKRSHTSSIYTISKTTISTRRRRYFYRDMIYWRVIITAEVCYFCYYRNVWKKLAQIILYYRKTYMHNIHIIIILLSW